MKKCRELVAIVPVNQPLVSVQTSNRVYSKPYIGASGALHYLKSKKRSLAKSENKATRQHKQFF